MPRKPIKVSEYSILSLVDYDKMFSEDPEAVALISDHRSFIMKNQASEYFDELFLSASKTNTSFIASCECGETVGNYDIGTICKKCKTKCVVNYNELKFKAWIEIPKELPPVPHPVLYRVLNTYLKTVPTKQRLIDVLLDIDNEGELPDILKPLMGRGMEYFYNNFTDIMNYFMNQHPPFQRKQYIKDNVDMKIFLDKYKDVLFVRHLPILNSSLHLITEQGNLKRSDCSSPKIFKSIIELATLTHNIKHSPKSFKYFDQQFYSVYEKYLDYIKSISEDKLTEKSGMIRKNLLGVRCNHSARAVIIPIIEEHDYDVVHMPWKMATTLYKLEILNILINRQNYTLSDALEKVTKSVMNYDKDIHKIIDILIKECKYKGLAKQIL